MKSLLVFVNGWNLFENTGTLLFGQKSYICLQNGGGTLDFLSDDKTFDSVQSAENFTLVFDSPTQDGIHVSCVLLTTPSSSYLVSLELLPGGTVLDYKQYICDCINNLAKVHCLLAEVLMPV